MEVRGTNRALVIGARGVLGALTVRTFASAGWDVLGAARRPRSGQTEIDLDDPDSIAAACDGHRLVVNTVPHADLLAERHILDRGGTLINISAQPAAGGRALRGVAAGATGTVLMNAGLAPGVTTVVATDLLRLHPDADELELVFTLSSESPRGPASTDFIHRGLTGVADHGTTQVPLPGPFGERVCLGFGEGDAGWLGGVAEGRIVRQYICLNELPVHERLLDLNRAGSINTPSRFVIGPRKPPPGGAASSEPVAHWIAAISRGRRLGARTVECRGDYLHAAKSAVVFADVLLGRRRTGGCFDPDEICTLADIEPALRKAGIAIVPRSG
ncbi:MAG TPA: NAD-dependent epimerase/dehydratase family protein [Solirubrobacteraceae bacterium]|nr:NAD-dependent epimerase/dehydratase family protein [Solirubrobacteraceae bacterium]